MNTNRCAFHSEKPDTFTLKPRSQALCQLFLITSQLILVVNSLQWIPFAALMVGTLGGMVLIKASSSGVVDRSVFQNHAPGNPASTFEPPEKLSLFEVVSLCVRHYL